MATTHTECRPGLHIMADNQAIYAGSQDYYADGAIVMRDESYTTTTPVKVAYTSTTHTKVTY